MVPESFDLQIFCKNSLRLFTLSQKPFIFAAKIR